MKDVYAEVVLEGLRAEILKVLSKPMLRDEIARCLSVNWRTVDHYLRVLEEYGLARSFEVGRRKYYVRSGKLRVSHDSYGECL